MKNRIAPCDPPQEAAIFPRIRGSHFHDCYRVPLKDGSLSPLDCFLEMARHTPPWVDAMMALRNRAVALVGLKNLGSFRPDKSGSAYAPGERLGIFTLESASPVEAILGDSDKHLDVALSFFRLSAEEGKPALAVTTVVHVRNTLGRLYMLPVKPMHKIIAPATLAVLAGETA